MLRWVGRRCGCSCCSQSSGNSFRMCSTNTMVPPCLRSLNWECIVDVCGVTISVRKKESIVSLWNKNCTLFNQTKLLYYIQSLLPSVTFLNVSYRGTLSCTVHTVLTLPAVHQNEANFKKELTSSPPHTPLSPMAKLSESPAAKLCDSPMAKLCDTKLSESPMSKLPDLSPPAAAPMHTPQTAVN
jgi:hypothetical protein